MPNNLGLGGGKAPTGYEYGPTGELQQMTPNQTNPANNIFTYGGNIVNAQTRQTTPVTPTIDNINGSMLTPATPIDVPSQPVDTQNYQGIINSGNALSEYFKTPTITEKPKDLTTLFSDLYSKSGLETKESKALESQKQLDILNAQMAALNAESTAVPIQMQQEAGKTLMTAGGLAPLQSARLRDIALRSLPLQGQILAQQAVATGDQRALEAAQSKFNMVFQIYQKNEENQYNYNKDLRDKVWEYATNKEKEKLVAQQKEDDRNFTLLQNNLNYAQNLSLKALESGQADLSTKITQLDPKSNTYAQDLAVIAGKIIQKPNTSIIEADGRKLLINSQTGQTIKDLGSATSGGGDEKVIEIFGRSLVDRTALDTAGTREQFIRQLQAQYPQIDPNDIARKVYETYPDFYNVGGTKGVDYYVQQIKNGTIDISNVPESMRNAVADKL